MGWGRGAIHIFSYLFCPCIYELRLFVALAVKFFPRQRPCPPIRLWLVQHRSRASSPGHAGLCGLLVASHAALVDAKQAILERIDPKSSAVFDGLGEELEADGGGGASASARRP